MARPSSAPRTPEARRHVIRVLGPLLIDDGDRVVGPRDLGGVRPKQVLEILLAARGHSVPVDRLTELIWGGSRRGTPPARCRRSCRSCAGICRPTAASRGGSW